MAGSDVLGKQMIYMGTWTARHTNAQTMEAVDCSSIRQFGRVCAGHVHGKNHIRSCHNLVQMFQLSRMAFLQLFQNIKVV